MGMPSVYGRVPCVTGSVASSRRRIPSVSKRDSIAFAFLLAIGLTIAAAISAVCSGIASGAVQNLAIAAGLSQDKAIKSEQQRLAVTLAQMERSLDIVRGQVARLAVQVEDASETARRAAHTDSEAASRQMPTDAATETGNPSSGPSDVELAALRRSIDEHDERDRAAFAAVNKRIDWLETLVYARDATSSGPPAAPQTALPAAAPSPAPTVRLRRRGVRASTETTPRWVVLHAEKGVAVISGKGGTVDVTPGYVIPELGRVGAIRMQDGHWQVITDKATLSQH